jgi:hypothetical protein
VEGREWRGVGGRDWVLGLLGYGCVTWPTSSEIEAPLEFRTFIRQELDQTAVPYPGSAGSVPLTDFLGIPCARKDQQLGFRR